MSLFSWETLIDTEIQELLKMFGAIISCYSRIKRGRLCYSDHGVEAKKRLWQSNKICILR